MPNYHVFNNADDPLYTQQVNTFIAPGIESTPEGDAAKAGILYATNFSATIAAGQNLILQTSNPLNSRKTIYVSHVSGSSLTVTVGPGSATATANVNWWET